MIYWKSILIIKITSHNIKITTKTVNLKFEVHAKNPSFILYDSPSLGESIVLKKKLQ